MACSFLAFDSWNWPIQFPGFNVELGCNRVEWLPSAQCSYLRLFALLPLPQSQTGQMVLYPVRLHRHRLGGIDPHGYSLFVRGPGWQTFLEFIDRWPSFSRFGFHGWTCLDHSGAPDHPPSHALQHL